MKSSITYSLELFIWLSALIFLATIDPADTGIFSFCLFHNLGIEFCPGCGLGRSISYFLHCNAADSFRTHILGIPAVIIIVHRIVTLIIHHRQTHSFIRTFIS